MYIYIFVFFFPDGYYMFIETSPPRAANDKARLISPIMAPRPLCFWFVYNMYGQNVNALNVYIKTTPALGTPIYTKQGTQGRAWNNVELDLTPTVPFQVKAFCMTSAQIDRSSGQKFETKDFVKFLFFIFFISIVSISMFVIVRWFESMWKIFIYQLNFI